MHMSMSGGNHEEIEYPHITSDLLMQCIQSADPDTWPDQLLHNT